MRVLILNQFFYPDISATSQLMTELAEDLVRQGAEVTAVSSNRAYTDAGTLAPEERYNGIHVVRARSSEFSRAGVLSRLWSYLTFYVSVFLKILYLRRQDVILVLTTPPLIVVVACLMKLLYGSRVVYLVQDLYPEVAVELGVLKSKWLVTKLLNRISQTALAYCDHVVVLGDCMREKVQAKGGRADKITVIRNWADGDGIQSVAREENRFRQDHGLQGKFVALYSGNLGKAHDFAAILATAKQLSGHTDIVFVFIGEGPKKAEITRFVETHNLANIRLLPYCSRDQLSWSLSSGDVLLVTLLHNLGGLVVPSKIYAAMAVGRPVVFIGPKSSEAANTIREADCGYVLENEEAGRLAQSILCLRDDPVLASRMGSNARAAFERRFQRSLATAQYFELLRRVADHSRRPGLSGSTG